MLRIVIWTINEVIYTTFAGRFRQSVHTISYQWSEYCEELCVIGTQRGLKWSKSSSESETIQNQKQFSSRAWIRGCFQRDSREFYDSIFAHNLTKLSRFSDTHVGDMFIIRNAGNLVPHSQFFQDEYFSCEPAGLELGCVVNDIRHIIVCGHSDCKAMNLLYQLQNPEFASRDNRIISPLRSWLCTHAMTSLEKYQALVANGERKFKLIN